ncbi:MAG: hypothetical protein ACYTGN_18615 [Planctomycetota bacterium]|jgi:tetratricopeptide (TPR) repeat protein
MHGKTSTILVMLAAAVAGLGGGLLAQTLRPEPAPVRKETPRTGDPVRERVEALSRDVDRKLAQLERRLATVRPPAPAARPAEAGTRRVHDDQPAATEPRRDPAGAAALIGELARETYTHRRAERLFQHLGRHHGEIASTIERLEQAIAKDPDNAHLHAALGTALSAKTAFTTRRGPEQGTVWMQAEKAFHKAIELDDNHWEARYSLAFGDSMAPEFVGLRPRAIERFEKLMDVQERQAQSDDHVLVYVRLGTLYKDAGNAKKAREVWERGQQRFPKHAEIADALRLIGED